MTGKLRWVTAGAIVLAGGGGVLGIREWADRQLAEGLAQRANALREQERVALEQIPSRHRELAESFSKAYYRVPAPGWPEELALRLRRYRDGTLRPNRDEFDPKVAPGVVAQDAIRSDFDAARRLLIAMDELAKWGEAWQGEAKATELILPEGAHLRFDPRQKDWAWDTPAKLVGPRTSPAKLSGTVWTDAVRTRQGWVITARTPIRSGGKLLAIVQTELDLDAMTKRLKDSTGKDAVAYLVRKDGVILSHPGFAEQWVKLKGRMNATKKGADPQLSEQVKTLLAQKWDDEGSVKVGEHHLAAAYVAGPKWYWVTVSPNAAAAERAAMPSAIVGAISLLAAAFVLTRRPKVRLVVEPEVEAEPVEVTHESQETTSVEVALESAVATPERLRFERLIEVCGTPQAACELAEVFLRAAPVRLDRIRKAIDAADAEALRRSSLTLAGSSATVEGLVVTDLCHALSEAPLEEAARRWPELYSEVANLRVELQSSIREYAA